MKICTTCKQNRELCLFGKNKTKPDGLDIKCKICRREYRIKNADIIKAKKASYYQENIERERAKRKIHRLNNKDQYLSRHKRWSEANTEHLKAYQDAYRTVNKQRKSEYQASKRVERTSAENLRRARKLNVTPRWANQKVINGWYLYANSMSSACGIKYHVDHIVPLQSNLVCGLHCEDNLQILPAAENIAKLNRYWPDMPNQDCYDDFSQKQYAELMPARVEHVTK